MLTLNRLNAVDADRLHRKLGRICEEGLSRRRLRLQSRVFLHLHKVLLHDHLVAQRSAPAA